MLISTCCSFNFHFHHFESNVTNPVQERSLKQMQQIQFKNFFETNTQKEIRTIELTISYNEFIYKLYNEFTLHFNPCVPSATLL